MPLQFSNMEEIAAGMHVSKINFHSKVFKFNKLNSIVSSYLHNIQNGGLSLPRFEWA